jgi:O-antigen/teichoic acid export membrane protein
VSGDSENQAARSPETAADARSADTVATDAARGVLWLTAQKWVVRVGGLVTMAILTRFLRPEEFGIMAAATAIAPLIYLLSDMGFTTYIVQADDADEATLSSGFWFSVGAGAVLCVTLALGAPALGLVLDLPEVVPIIRWITLSVAFVSLGSVPTAILRRRMAFRALAVQSVFGALAAQVAALVLVFSGAGIWALVAQYVVSQAVACVLAWRAARWVPRSAPSWLRIRTMTRFGAKVVAVEFVAVGRSMGETAVIASWAGATALGYYAIAQRLVQVLQDLSVSALIPVTTVAIARLRSDAQRLRSFYLTALHTAYAGVSPLMALVAVGGSAVIPIVFGQGWEPSVLPFQFLAVAGIFALGAGLDHGVMYGVGRPGLWFAYSVVTDAVTLATTAFLVRYGLPAIALGFVAVTIVATLCRWLLLRRIVGISVRTISRPVLMTSVAVLPAAAVGVGIMRLASGLPQVIALGLAGIGLFLTHALIVRATSPEILRTILRVLPGRASQPLLRLARLTAPAVPRRKA